MYFMCFKKLVSEDIMYVLENLL